MSERKNNINKNTTDNIPLEKDIERLRRDIYYSDMEKLKLFTKMLRTNALYKKAIVTHK